MLIKPSFSESKAEPLSFAGEATVNPVMALTDTCRWDKDISVRV